jgi:dihydrofolate reductase
MVGAGIIASFLDEGEIDEFIISVVPVMIGEGIPLIAPGPSYLAPPQADRRYEVHGRRGQAPLLGP